MITICCHEHIKIIGETQKVWSDWLLAIATLILALATLYLLSEAKKQLKKVKEFIEKYTTFNQVQSAENIIIKQIEFHYKLLERIEAIGKYTFKEMYNDFEGYYRIDTKEYNNIAEKIEGAYQKLYDSSGYLIGHYYRHLYRIFKNIDETKIFSDSDKNRYAKLVRAQLSEYEILLLFYNCIWIANDDESKFKNLVETYELLKGINESKISNLDALHFSLYSSTAFGGHGN